MATQDVRIEEFLDRAGHELRIPITALKGQLQLMRRRWGKQGATPEQLSDLDRLLYQTDRVNYLLQVMLDAFHVSEGGLQLLPSEVEYDLGDLITAQLRTSGASNATHTIHFQPPNEAPITGNWDRTRIETVVSVLLANATRYSARGEITVTLARKDQHAHIEVSDRGIGVPAKERASIFEAYEHGSNAENYGMGLGLYVAREIVRAHGGQIGVEPREGGGSAFWFTLPLARLMTLSEQAAQAGTTAIPATSAPSEQETTAHKPARSRAPRKSAPD